MAADIEEGSKSAESSQGLSFLQQIHCGGIVLYQLLHAWHSSHFYANFIE